jgi:hypothetical protein
MPIQRVLKPNAVKATHIAANAVGSSEIDLADTFAFTGTVTGSGTKQLLRDVTVSSATSSVEFVHGSNGVVFDTTYSRYELNIDKVVAGTNNAHIELFASSNAGSSYYGDNAYNLVIDRSYTNNSSTIRDIVYDFLATNRQNVGSDVAHGGVNATVILTAMGTTNRTVAYSNFWAFGGSSYHIQTMSLGSYASNSVAINAVKWAFASGDIASGRFKLYGVR